MTNFVYKAYDSSGGKVEGQIESQNKTAALSQLKEQGLLVTDIKDESVVKSKVLNFSSKISLADLEFLTSELSLLLDSGVKIDKGIDIIKKTKAKPALSRLLSGVSSSLKKGQSLSQAFREYPDAFDDLYCNLIELGEASGNLADIFSGLSKDLKFKRDLRSKVISSLTYPVVILFVCILAIFFIFNFIIPKMSSMFSGADSLPWYTQAMLSISDWMLQYQSFLIVGVAMLLFSASVLFKQPKLMNWWQKFSLKLPVLSSAILIIERIRFNAGLALMIKSGVQIDKALALASGNIKNEVLRGEINVVRAKVKAGSLLTPALKQTSIYPDFFISLLEVGEESGNLERVFNEIANRSRQEFESWTSRVTTLLEPLMILFMGGFVGGVVVMMLMSMVSINELGI
ncbi:type II secretion system F family protein [Thalassotalea euphylliae]|uniref:type II secretion system F family protein n=1 Tax=Thalassotalea euphylliae TaxID=1655234 RepID=UPI003636EAA2